MSQTRRRAAILTADVRRSAFGARLQRRHRSGGRAVHPTRRFTLAGLNAAFAAAGRRSRDGEDQIGMPSEIIADSRATSPGIRKSCSGPRLVDCPADISDRPSKRTGSRWSLRWRKQSRANSSLQRLIPC
jgi:hypothetical protein